MHSGQVGRAVRGYDFDEAVIFTSGREEQTMRKSRFTLVVTDPAAPWT
jgi:hypothetical protein